MLVLTQKEGEVLQLGDDIRIYIKRVKGNMVRLCIDAPREIAIVRVPATPIRRPLNRAVEDNHSDETGQADLDLRAAGEALSHGGGDYPVEQETATEPIGEPSEPSLGAAEDAEAD